MSNDSFGKNAEKSASLETTLANLRSQYNQLKKSFASIPAWEVIEEGLTIPEIREFFINLDQPFLFEMQENLKGGIFTVSMVDGGAAVPPETRGMNYFQARQYCGENSCRMAYPNEYLAFQARNKLCIGEPTCDLPGVSSTWLESGHNPTEAAVGLMSDTNSEIERFSPQKAPPRNGGVRRVFTMIIDIHKRSFSTQIGKIPSSALKETDSPRRPQLSALDKIIGGAALAATIAIGTTAAVKFGSSNTTNSSPPDPVSLPAVNSVEPLPTAKPSISASTSAKRPNSNPPGKPETTKQKPPVKPKPSSQVSAPPFILRTDSGPGQQ